MRDLIIIFESTRYDAFLAAETSVLDQLSEPVKATTHGAWTRPSITSILSGYLPQSKLGQIYKPSWVMLSPEVFYNKLVPSYFLNANAWVKNMHPRRYEDMFYGHHEGEKMVMDASKIMREEPDFCLVIFFEESHVPYDLPGEDMEEVETAKALFKAYNQGQSNNAPELAFRRSCRAISYLDKLIEPIIDIPDRVIFTGDHGELMGENHRIGHDPSFPFHRKLVEVPLIISEGYV